MSTIVKVTEAPSKYDNLEQIPIKELLENINNEDKSVPLAVEKVIPKIEHLVNEVVARMKQGGRLFYIGAGTSGRLGILDASEIPPTYGFAADRIIGIIAGGDEAIRNAVENAEDDPEQAFKDLKNFGINKNDVLVGIAASGTTPYVVGGVKMAKELGILTSCITCNPETPLESEVDIPIAVIVGPEFVTGSTRMKAGTAQKLVLNMISTTVMIQLGRVKGNKMVDMQLSNNKLVNRGTRMIMEELFIEKEQARQLLLKYGSVRKAIEEFKKNA
jgi:N-acetylmuramic acid 6-phosphate etherase